MLSSIAKGKSVIRNFSTGTDCISTMNMFKQLGVEINYLEEKTLEVFGGKLNKSIENLNAGNSGTTMRLVSGILAGQEFSSTIIGDESLSKRPMQRIIDPLIKMGAEIKSNNGRAPLFIRGSHLHGIAYYPDLSSAQVKSCVLLAGINPTTSGMTVYNEKFCSRNHTELMLEYLGANIKYNKNEVTVFPSELLARDIEIVGDISSAAFLIVAGLIIEGSDFVIKNVGINETRAGILDVVQRMNGDIEVFNERIISGEKVADIRVRYSEELCGCEIFGKDIPRLIDELPIIAVLASQAEGETIVKDACDLRNKEADRIVCLVNELKKIGVEIEELPDGFIVRGKKNLLGEAELEAYHDHRLAMSFYVAGLICEKEISINGFEWVNISFPEFESLIEELKM